MARSGRTRRMMLGGMLAATVARPALAGDDTRYVRVEFGAFIVQHRSPRGRIIPLHPDRIRFRAAVMRAPEPVHSDYLMSVLKMTGIDPLPHVSEQAFLKADNGIIQAVYLEDAVAAQMRTTLQAGQRAEFLGLRAYDYTKGPAILIEGMRPGDE